MKAITCWVGRFVTQALKTIDKNKMRKVTKSRQIICSESLSSRMRDDIGLDNESSDAADYTKYL
ncbi:hypothetical protein BCV39_17920 [Vibrio sp. 10N.286.55.E10]|nr:hypothetical protein BCV40_13130 [Vibrio sp. 10N.286.55.E12]PME35637.1 hypothetical protein BCV39_17920 [Vibrio sp. 10N.286.55.E10]PME66876.1 hypothetical protein BCV32_16700 [Vibrio sp. 10N.286.55.C11]PMI21993.1 hypothetical protein BCU50_12835 [Vibrio sp. 10N.286.46.E10]PMI98314.1 hypothetical protein BCU34_01755 [Vibrio sp. 10N.286.45.E10]PTO97631.1 hypothetical protein CWO08_03175 [Vibrio sp. 10N.286.48.B8]PTP07955.1 hypothetical protein CWO17_06765 [Vibrio sp. 10N.286.45.A3]PTP15847.